MRTVFTVITTSHSRYSTSKTRHERWPMPWLPSRRKGGRSAASLSEILQQGTGREFSPADNRHWLERAAPIVQAFFHARYFLEMAVKYDAALADPPQPMPSGLGGAPLPLWPTLTLRDPRCDECKGRAGESHGDA